MTSTSGSTTADTAQFLKVTVPGMAMDYFNYNASWNTGWISPTWINGVAGATNCMITVPMLNGSPTGSPVDLNSGTGQTISPQNPSNVTTPTTMTMADVAAGVWDSLFGQAFATIAGVRPDCILRIGWELYLPGAYPWSGIGLSALHTACYQHLVTLARTKSASFKFDWNGATAWGAYNPMTYPGAYPGDSYVDYITVDIYESKYYDAGAAGFAEQASQVIQDGLNFSIAHGKPFCWSEFGLEPLHEPPDPPGGWDDDPAYIEAAYYWLRAHEADMGYVNWFNVYPQWGAALQYMPQSAAMFTKLFGAWAQELAGATKSRFVSSTGTNRLRLH